MTTTARGTGTRRAELALAAGVLLAGCASAPGPAPPPARPRAALASASHGARCGACGHVVPGPEALRWPDGRFTCGRCHTTAVVDPAEARAVLEEARGDLRRLFGIDIGAAALTFALVDLEALAERAGPDLAGPMLQAITWFETGPDARADVEVAPPFEVGIEVVYGLPRASLRGVLVHELFHVHQALVGRGHGRRFLGDPRVGDIELAFVEGAALWAQRRALIDLGQVAQAERLDRDPDPVYGAGLRRFRDLVASHGERRALELGASAGRFPPGR